MSKHEVKSGADPRNTLRSQDGGVLSPPFRRRRPPARPDDSKLSWICADMGLSDDWFWDEMRHLIQTAYSLCDFVFHPIAGVELMNVFVGI